MRNVKATKKESRLLGFATEAARSRKIASLVKEGFNYFVCYEDKKLKNALQYAKSTSEWVKKHSKHGVLVEGR